MKITIKDVAKHAGVSITTVSLVLNNKGPHISAETKKRILASAETLQYQPNQVARSLVTAQSKNIAVLLPDIANPFFSELAKGISDTLSEQGYNLMLFTAYNDRDKEMKILSEMASFAIDGLLLSTVNSSDDMYKNILQHLNKPIVILDRGIPSLPYHYIGIDDRAAAFAATNYLVEQGHQDIGCIAGEQQLFNLQERVNGYCDALMQKGIAQKYIVFTELTTDSGYEQTMKLLQQNPQITALVTHNDLQAIGVYQAAKKMNKKIPEDLSVIGFDDIEMAQYLIPSLTTVHQPTYKIGEVGAQHILALLNRTEDESNDVDLLPTQLQVRGSVSTIN